MSRPVLFLCAALAALTTQGARAQVPDTSGVQGPDSLFALPDSVQAAPADSVVRRPQGPPMAFINELSGRVIADTLPARLPVFSLAGLLAGVPGGFLYEFGTPGWPDAWSPYGLRPEQVQLTFQGLPFNDLASGRPRYDLLPLSFLQPVRMGAGPFGRSLAVITGLRAYSEARPLTELRYWSGAGSFQSIEVEHAQQRPVSLFERRSTLHVLGGYGGRAAQGEYPGSSLRRERRLTGRIRFASRGWSVEVLDLYNRQNVGAHGGVDAGPGESIYQRVGAAVFNDGARRQTIRNDLSLRLHGRPLGIFHAPAVLTGFWTAQLSRYMTRDTSAGFQADRMGLHVRQALGSGSRPLTADLALWRDTWEPEADSADLGRSRPQLHALVRDTLGIGMVRLTLQAGAHADGGYVFPDLSAVAESRLGSRQVVLSARLSGQPVSSAERYGFGAHLEGIGDARPGLAGHVEAELRPSGEGVSLGANLFGGYTGRALDVYVVSGDTAQTFLSEHSVLRAGATLDFGWRREAERGLYATLQPTFLQVTGGGDAGPHAPIAESVPRLYGSGRFGLRALLFRGDLDLDVHLDGRFWSATRSRTLHPATGLLVLRPEGAPRIGPSGVLNVVVEAGVRTATIFVAWDNVLASSTGGGLYPGVQIVPLYPLPERRFRFGVFWPIQD